MTRRRRAIVGYISAGLAVGAAGLWVLSYVNSQVWQDFSAVPNYSVYFGDGCVRTSVWLGRPTQTEKEDGWKCRAVGFELSYGGTYARPDSLNLRHDRYALQIPFLALFACFLIYPVVVFIRGDFRRNPPGCCQHCGYNLTGNVSGRCPECGSSVAGAAEQCAGASRSARARAMILIGLLATTTFTAARIEILNASVGGILPRERPPDNLGSSKWRSAPWFNEEMWRRTIGPKDEQGRPVSRPLTESEQLKMKQDIEQALTWNRLRDVVGSWGCAQYMLVPAAFLIALSLIGDKSLKRHLRLLGGAGLILSAAAATLMFYRAYFSSLGM